MCGCTSTVNNTLFAERKKNIASSIKDVGAMRNKLENGSNYPLNCYLVSVRSIPNFLKLIPKDRNGLIGLEELSNYELETNIEVYHDFKICKTIFEQIKEKNEFIIVSNEFIQNMEIKVAKDVTLKKENNQIKVYFENEEKKMVIEQKSSSWFNYKFIDFEEETTIEIDKSYAESYKDTNKKDSFLLQSLINCLTNIDIFKNVFVSNEKNIRNNRNHYEISNYFLDIIKKENNEHDIRRQRKAFISLHSLLYKKNKLIEPKNLFFSLINNLSKEYNPNPFPDLFALKHNIYYICQNCKLQYKGPNNNYCSCLEFNLEDVRKFKSTKRNFFIDLDIKDCFSYEEYSKKKSNYICQYCRREIADINIIYKIEIFPNILVIILDRGKYISENQIEFNIEFNDNKSILDLTYLSMPRNKITYDLIGVFSYKKKESIDKVYNTVFCKIDHNNNEWIYYDKYYGKKIEKMEIGIMHTPFMLFYLKK